MEVWRGYGKIWNILEHFGMDLIYFAVCFQLFRGSVLHIICQVDVFGLHIVSKTVLIRSSVCW